MNSAEMKVILVLFLLFGLSWGAGKVTPKPKVSSTTTPKPEPVLNCECGKRNAGRMFGGTPTRKNEYPWVAALEDTKSKDHFCGGSVITERHILTAAHCVWGVKSNDVEVVLGGHDLSKATEDNSQRLKIERIIIHETYDNDTQHDDIAILVTSTKIKYNDWVGPVCMPAEPLKNNVTGQSVKALGWGLIAKKYTVESIKQLREVDLDVVVHENCQEPGASQICTWKPGKDVCVGDSGGPMVWLHPRTNRFTQVALVSYGWDDECGVVTEPGMNTDVSAYICWIDQQIFPLRHEVETCHEI